MRRIRKNGSFWLCLIVNIFLNLEGTIPAWILLALHFILDWPLWLVFAALGLWVAGIILWMKVMGWATRCGNIPDRPKENKNPYSSQNSDFGQG